MNTFLKTALESNINPFRKKRTYNEMIQQDHSITTPVNFIFKTAKKNDGKIYESLIKDYKSRIPERLRREIELYNYQKRGLYLKVIPCKCQK